MVIFNVQKELCVGYAVQPALFARPLQSALTVWMVCRSSPCVGISCEARVPAPGWLLSGQQPSGWADSASLTLSCGTRDVTLSCGCCFSWGEGQERKRASRCLLHWGEMQILCGKHSPSSMEEERRHEMGL